MSYDMPERVKAPQGLPGSSRGAPGKHSLPSSFHPVAARKLADGTHYVIGFDRCHGTGYTMKQIDGNNFKVLVPRYVRRISVKKGESVR